MIDHETPENDEKRDYRDLALKRLSVREYGSGEMRQYLIRKGAAEDEAERIVAELVESKTIDDERYARVIARHQAFRAIWQCLHRSRWKRGCCKQE